MFIPFKIVLFDIETFKIIKQVFTFNIKINLTSIKIFQNFYDFELKYKLDYPNKINYAELHKNKRRILFSMKTINKYLKLKNIKNLRNIVMEITISNIAKALMNVSLYQNIYSKFRKIKSNFKYKIRKLKKFLVYFHKKI